jgi:hypothetical protein
LLFGSNRFRHSLVIKDFIHTARLGETGACADRTDIRQSLAIVSKFATREGDCFADRARDK